jgi:hypothetical protein
MITKELALLDEEEATLLPARQTLGLFDFALISASNTSVALNSVTLLSAAISNAGQTIVVVQH